MSRRKNFLDTMNHNCPADLILDLGGNPLSSMEGRSMSNLLDFLGFKPAAPSERLLFGQVQRIDERILEYLDIDTRSVGGILKPQRSQFSVTGKNEYTDEWGINRRFDGMYWDITENPLKNATVDDLDSYVWPVATSVDYREIEKAARKAKNLYENTDYIICAEHPVYGVFELGCWLCGFDDFLVKVMIDPDFVKKLFDIIMSYQNEIIDIYYGALGEYIHYTSSGDDFAAQSNLFMSPEIFRRLVKPYYKERIERTKNKTNAFYLHHSCGSVRKLINDLIEVGVDILNPIQPEAADMSPEELKAEYGDNIVFHGGIGTQQALFNDSAKVDNYIKNTVHHLGKDGGYIFAAAHNLQEDVSPETVIGVFQAGRKYGKSNE